MALACQPRPRRRHGAAHIRRRRAAQAGAALDRGLDREAGPELRGDAGLDPLHLGQRQLGEAAALLLGQAHQRAGDVMGLAEGQPQIAHQPVGEIRRGDEAAVAGLAHGAGIGRQIADHAGHGGEGEREIVDRQEHRLLVLLHVLAIGQRQALQHHEKLHQRPDGLSRLAAHQLGRIGIALLRHDRAAGGEGIAQGHEAEALAGPEYQLLGEARKMGGEDGAGGQELDGEVAGRNGIHGIGHRPREAERGGRGRRVDGKAGAGERAGAERAFVQAAAAIGEASAVARQHLDIGQQMMAEGDGLGDLKMGEARHDGRRMLLGPIEEGLGQLDELGVEPVDGLAQPEAEIHRHLIVARAGGMEPPGRRADQLAQP